MGSTNLVKKFKWNAELRTRENITVPVFFREGNVPTLVVGNWKLSPRKADLFREDAHDWLSGGLQFMYDKWKKREDKKETIEEFPSNVEIYERLRSKKVDEDRPIARIKVEWDENDRRGSRIWAPANWTRTWVELGDNFAVPAPNQVGVAVSKNREKRSKPGSEVSDRSFPVEAEVIRSRLMSLFGREEGGNIWTEVCGQCVASNGQQTRREGQVTGDQVRTIVDQLRKRGGKAQVIGKSLDIKIKAHEQKDVGPAPKAVINGKTPEKSQKVRDPDRLRELARIGALDKSKDLMDRQARKAAAITGDPMAMVSLVLGEAGWPIGTYGEENYPQWMKNATGVPIEWCFCNRPTETGEVYIFEDAKTEPEVKESPLVRDGVRSYLGVPLITSQSEVIGTLLTVSPEKSNYGDGEVKNMKRLASKTMTFIEK
jgi:hypothetical protein